MQSRLAPVVVTLGLCLSCCAALAAEPQPLAGVRRVVFLGDSITYTGQYVEYVEAILRTNNPELDCEFLDLGLPSETVSGLSEPGHAGGQFPRPDLRERLDRVLEQTKPDLIVACYGMNDGIYYPFSDERFEKYQQGIQFLRERATAASAKVLHLTPPVFDSLPIKAKTLPAGLAEYQQPYEGYDEVLSRYAAWLVAQTAGGWEVVDIHTPMKEYLAAQRARDAGFRLAGDGVHIDSTGHWLIARELLLHWKAIDNETAVAASAEKVLSARRNGPEVLKLVAERQRLLKDAWLTATGHKRPGMNPGLPLEEASRLANELNAKIKMLLTAAP
jgi:lysophospholipase L1-like esterase